MSILEITNLKFGYNDITLFNNLEMKLYREDHMGLIGANGVGKTTLLNLIAQKIEGSGFTAVATIGIVFANVLFREKSMVRKKVSFLDSIIEFFIFIFAGLVVGLPFSSLDFYKNSFGIFLLYLVIRFASAQVLLTKKYDFAERLEIAFLVPKGLVTVVMAFSLLVFTFSGINLMFLPPEIV